MYEYVYVYWVCLCICVCMAMYVLLYVNVYICVFQKHIVDGPLIMMSLKFFRHLAPFYFGTLAVDSRMEPLADILPAIVSQLAR